MDKSGSRGDFQRFLVEKGRQQGMARRRRTSRRKKSSGAGFLRAVLLVLLLAAGAGAAWLVFEPFGPETETFVEIAPGSSFMRVGQQLEAAGIVRNR
jgi:UPF0755 protein